MEKPTLIPNYIEAKSKDELMEKILMINLSVSTYHRFFDIQREGKKWVAWYYKDVEQDIRGRIK